jgi:hypothetical protein
MLNLIAVALFLPWLPIAIRQVTGWTVERPAYDLNTALLDVYRWLIVGRTLPLADAALPLIAFGSLALIGLVVGREQLANRLSMLVLAVLPLVLLFVFNLYRDAYLKFLLVCVLPLFVLAARGIIEIGDWRLEIWRHRFNLQSPISNLLSAGIALILAAAFIPSLRNLYDNPAYARDDYRGIQRMIASGARENDAVLFIAPNQWEVYTYYQGDDKGLYPLKYRPNSPDEVARQLEEIAGAHQRLFVLYYAEREADPNNWYERWLAENTNKGDEQWIGNIRLAVYRGSGVGNRESALNARFGDAIELLRVKTDLSDVRAGDVLPVDLVWRAGARPDRRYKVFIHVGLPDALPVAQNDGEPVAGFRPTDSWNPDEQIIDRRGVWIKPGAPPGHYGVYVGMYDAATGARLPIRQNDQLIGDRLKIGEITIR